MKVRFNNWNEQTFFSSIKAKTFDRIMLKNYILNMRWDYSYFINNLYIVNLMNFLTLVKIKYIKYLIFYTLFN